MASTDFIINSVKVAAPVSFLPTIADMVTNSKRMGNGKVRFNYVATKRTWEGKWEFLTMNEYQEILNAIEGVSLFSISLFDPELGENTTKTFYKGDRKFDKWQPGTDGYASISVSFIEE